MAEVWGLHPQQAAGQGIAGPPNIGINVGSQKVTILGLMYPHIFGSFLGSNVPIWGPTSEKILRCTLLDLRPPIWAIRAHMYPNFPQTYKEHIFLMQGHIFIHLSN